MELILNAQAIDNSPKTVALIFDLAGQLLDGKGIKPPKGLKDHPLFHSNVQLYSIRDGKMTVGLHTCARYPEYFAGKGKVDYNLPPSKTLDVMDEGLK